MNDRASYDISKTIGYQFSKISQLYSQRLDQELAVYGLSGQSWYILIALIEMQISKPSAIADYLKVKRASLSRTLTDMEKQGLITREAADADKRARAIVATKTAHDMYRKALPQTLSISNHFRAKLSGAEFETLRILLDKVLEGEFPSDQVQFGMSPPGNI